MYFNFICGFFVDVEYSLLLRIVAAIGALSHIVSGIWERWSFFLSLNAQNEWNVFVCEKCAIRF